MLNVTDQCFISPAAVKGLPAIREIICVFLRHNYIKGRHQASLLTATRNLGQNSPSFHSLLLHFTLWDGGFALSFVWIESCCETGFS